MIVKSTSPWMEQERREAQWFAPGHRANYLAQGSRESSSKTSTFFCLLLESELDNLVLLKEAIIGDRTSHPA